MNCFEGLESRLKLLIRICNGNNSGNKFCEKGKFTGWVLC